MAGKAGRGLGGKGKSIGKANANTPIGEGLLQSNSGLRLDFASQKYYFRRGDKVTLIKEAVQGRDKATKWVAKWQHALGVPPQLRSWESQRNTA